MLPVEGKRDAALQRGLAKRMNLNYLPTAFLNEVLIEIETALLRFDVPLVLLIAVS